MMGNTMQANKKVNHPNGYSYVKEYKSESLTTSNTDIDSTDITPIMTNLPMKKLTQGINIKKNLEKSSSLISPDSTSISMKQLHKQHHQHQQQQQNCSNGSTMLDKESLLYCQNQNDALNLNTKNAIGGIAKGLSIDINEAETIKNSKSNNYLNNGGPLSTINNSANSVYGLAKNSLISNASGGGSTTKNISSKTFDLKKNSTNPVNVAISPHNLSANLLNKNNNLHSAANKNNLPPISPHTTPSNITHKQTSFQLLSNSVLNLQGTSTTTHTNQTTAFHMAENNIHSSNSTHDLFNETKSQCSHQQQPISTTPMAKKNILPNHEPTKCSVKKNGVVRAYAANTNRGIVRNYNEDRVSIILNMIKPANRAHEVWPNCSFFGIYDGHGGSLCADFLRDKLHQFVINNSNFPYNPREALLKGFEEAEKAFLALAEDRPEDEYDVSGSCAVIVLIVGEICYVANVGDSRAVMSGENGKKIYELSRDHKPMDEIELKRIIEAGGKIYQSKITPNKNQLLPSNLSNSQYLLGPHRVLPGRLSVCRTFGDIEAKLPKYGGNPNVVIAIPDIKSFKITEEHDFIVLASDGIYDKLNSEEVINVVWNSTKTEHAPTIHKQCGVAVEHVLCDAINRRTLDNVTVVILAFNNFKQALFPSNPSTPLKSQGTNSTKESSKLLNNSLKLIPLPSSSSSDKENQIMDRDIPAVKNIPHNMYYNNSNLKTNENNQSSIQISRFQYSKENNTIKNINEGKLNALNEINISNFMNIAASVAANITADVSNNDSTNHNQHQYQKHNIVPNPINHILSCQKNDSSNDVNQAKKPLNLNTSDTLTKFIKGEC